MTITETTRVMSHDGDSHAVDAGTVADVFGNRWPELAVGESQGEDWQRGAYNWWPVTLDGQHVAELRDDATGLTLHVTA